MLGMGVALSHHGVLENGRDGLLSAVDELKEKGAIQDLTGCRYGGMMESNLRERMYVGRPTICSFWVV